MIKDLERYLQNWQYVLQFAARLIDHYEIGKESVRIGAVTFSQTARLEFPLNRYYVVQSMKEALMRLPYVGRQTNLAEAIRTAREQCFQIHNGDRRNTPNLAIIVTVGESDQQILAPAVSEAQMLMNLNTRIVLVGVSNDLGFLRQVSSTPQIQGQGFFQATDFATLPGMSQQVVENTCVAPTSLPGNYI